VTIWVSTIGCTFITIIDFPGNIFYISANFGQFVILCPFKPQMWHAYEDVFYVFSLGCATYVVATVVFSFFFQHVSTLWFVIPQFLQCLLVFPTLFCVFFGAACLVLYGTNNTLLISAVVIPSSHNIATSSCCCNVDHFIPAVIIIRYDYKPTLNIVVRKLSMVGTCKPLAKFWICS
jgi:hypothetical protein